MSKKKEEKMVTYTRFMYTLISYIAEEFRKDFEISSYVNNMNSKSSFAKSKVSTFIKRNSKVESINRFFLTISLESDFENYEAEKKFIEVTVAEKFETQFESSEPYRILKSIDHNASIQMFSKGLASFFIIIFDVAENSSIECIISSKNLTKKIIDREDDGTIVEYNSALHKNLSSFKGNL